MKCVNCTKYDEKVLWGESCIDSIYEGTAEEIQKMERVLEDMKSSDKYRGCVILYKDNYMDGFNRLQVRIISNIHKANDDLMMMAAQMN